MLSYYKDKKENLSPMPANDYHQRIVDYYKSTENAYKDTWDLDNSLSIHYGYWDDKVSSFPQSLQRMNEIMIEAAGIKSTDRILDAGCGIGGSAIFIAAALGAKVTGITLSERQVEQATANAEKKGVSGLVDFRVMDYSATSFPDQSFDIVWGCESVCYADDKGAFIREAFRLLKPGGRLIVADGFVTRIENNNHELIGRWLDGWQVNYLETPERFQYLLHQTGFTDIRYQDISAYTRRSAARLNRFYYMWLIYSTWKKLTFSDKSTPTQRKNNRACKYQYLALVEGLWRYGLIVAKKP